MIYKDINFQNVESDLIDSDAIKASVRNIVFIEVGELLGMPEFGCRTKSLLFDQLDMFSASSAQSMIINALYRYEARITDIKVVVTSEPAQRKIVVKVDYSIKNINTKDNVSVRLK
jgi:phage baseplate assembly protein W